MVDDDGRSHDDCDRMKRWVGVALVLLVCAFVVRGWMHPGPEKYPRVADFTGATDHCSYLGCALPTAKVADIVVKTGELVPERTGRYRTYTDQLRSQHQALCEEHLRWHVADSWPNTDTTLITPNRVPILVSLGAILVWLLGVPKIFKPREYDPRLPEMKQPFYFNAKPDDAGLRASRGAKAVARKDYETALSDLTPATEPATLFNRALALAHLERPQEALADVLEFRKLAPEDSEGPLLHSDILVALGMRQEARAVLEELVRTARASSSVKGLAAAKLREIR